MKRHTYSFILFVCSQDPFIDDNIEFARRLLALKVTHYIHIVEEYPHGFLDFGFASNNIAQFNVEILSMLQNIVRQSSSNDAGDNNDSNPTFTN